MRNSSPNLYLVSLRSIIYNTSVCKLKDKIINMRVNSSSGEEKVGILDNQWGWSPRVQKITAFALRLPNKAPTNFFNPN